MARTGRAATRHGDIHNIMEDLERGDEISYDTPVAGSVDARVRRVYKSQISTWGIARLIITKRLDGSKQDELMTVYVKAPGHLNFADRLFNVRLKTRSVDVIEAMEVIG